MNLSNNYILENTDCLEYMKTLPDNSIDMILQDPPFNSTACKWEWDIMTKIDEFWSEWNRIIKSNGAIVMFGNEPFSSKLRLSNLKMYKYDLIWEKPQGVDPFMSKIRPLNNIENISIFCQSKTVYNPQMTIGKPYHIIRDKMPRYKEHNNAIMKQTETINNGERLPTRILKFKQEKGLHKTQKPVALLKYLIKTYTNENEIIFDGFVGSGSTIIAALNTNRKCIGCELDSEYYQVAKNRIEKCSNQY